MSHFFGWPPANSDTTIASGSWIDEQGTGPIPKGQRALRLPGGNMSSASPAASLGTEADLHAGDTGTFMITLCRLSKPISIQPPRSAQLASFTFFTSRSRQPEGSERLYLHMGYFKTLSDAQQWSERLRTRYPNAIATPVPPALLPRPDSETPALQAALAPATPPVQDFPPVEDDTLSDTQVLRILEARHGGGPGNATDERIELLQPDDTQTRRTLKEAVATGVPVPFAVQLEWSVQPIDADRVPLLDAFKGYTLYRMETRRAGRSRYFLRLGFFADPLSAKELACQVRSAFAAAAVVPVTEEEFLHAAEARIDVPDPAAPLHQGTHDPPNCELAPGCLTPASTVRAEPTVSSKPACQRPASASQESLEQTLEILAKRATWGHRDSLSDTGVRHLKIMIDQRAKTAHKPKRPTRFT